jgi:phospholipase/carboxylesterase
MPYAPGMELLHTAHVPAGEGPFPTVVALHGWGASAHDLVGLAPALHGGEALVLCPQGPVAFEAAPGMVGYGWFPISLGHPPDPAAFDKGASALRSFLDAAQASYPVDPRKLVLLGFSQGGVMAYDLALREPERFAGLVVLSSWLPDALADGLLRQPAYARLPTLVVHGTRDPMIPIERGRSSRDRLQALGVPTTYREYEMEHEIRPEALRDLVAWLEERVLREASAVQ